VVIQPNPYRDRRPAGIEPAGRPIGYFRRQHLNCRPNRPLLELCATPGDAPSKQRIAVESVARMPDISSSWNQTVKWTAGAPGQTTQRLQVSQQPQIKLSAIASTSTAVDVIPKPTFASASGDYLRSIDLDEDMVKRVGAMVEAFEWLCPEPLERIFICDQPSDSGKDRQLTSLWGFSSTFCMETKQFLSSENFDMVPFRSSIVWLEVEGSDVAGNRDDNAGTLSVTFHLGPNLPCLLTATGANCKYLKSTLQDLLVPNMRNSMF
jgi:hypothetical protein